MSSGNRVVNEVDVENYLRGVLPKEVPPSWGDSGGGSGMHALRAQSVAARSYGLSQSRYGYASTCDTSSCQVYGGAATRTSADSGNW
ncbi:MAG: SpoIID/LytB domain-containing protein, partial [Ilumatobacter sp.]|nr:SpoIID/LytB domain-containing protein [Ilumatobacter sp.]